MGNYEELKALLDDEEKKIWEFLKIYEDLTLEELKKEVKESVHYSKKMEEELRMIAEEGIGNPDYSTTAYAWLTNKYALLMYELTTLIAYNKKLEKALEIKSAKIRKNYR